MKCKLCNLERELANSHVIPEFVFRPLYDSKHRFYKITSSRGENNSHLQKGIREPLLCFECEGIISKNEKYVSEIFNGRIEVLLTNVGGHVIAEGIDYLKFKLFALSVLWRAGVASDQFYKNVSLGVHEEILRKMLFESNPGQSDDYPFILTLIIHENQLFSGLIMEPESVPLAGHNVFRFVFSGLVWIFFVSEQPLPQVLQDASINRDGQLKLLYKKLTDLRFITAQAVEFSAMGKLNGEMR